jgi:hypothetical protein
VPGVTPSDPEAASKVAEAQRRWEEALKNDPKRAEQMEYRARRASGPALSGSDEEKGGTAAENKFCQDLAGEHAIFDGKEGGCRCKSGYTEDDEGKCVRQTAPQAQGAAGVHVRDQKSGSAHASGKRHKVGLFYLHKVGLFYLGFKSVSLVL